MLNFPDAPTVNQIFTSGTLSWRWDGTKWVVNPGSALAANSVVVNSTTTLTTGFSGTVRIQNNTSAPITITMPASPTIGQQVLLKDMSGNAGTYAITIDGGVPNIEGANTLVLNYNYNWVELYYSGTQWVQV